MMTRLLMVIILLPVAACATIVHGTGQEVPIASRPPGARVIVDQVPRGTTPLTVNLKRKQAHVVRIESDGYKPYEALLRRDTSDWLWGNIIICCGLVGMGVDAMTGAFYSLEPEEIYMELETVDHPTPGPGGK